jgi:hypothetical protein
MKGAPEQVQRDGPRAGDEGVGARVAHTGAGLAAADG